MQSPLATIVTNAILFPLSSLPSFLKHPPSGMQCKNIADGGST